MRAMSLFPPVNNFLRRCFSPKHYPPIDAFESNCRLNTVRRWHSRYSPHGDLSGEYAARGVPSENLTTLRVFAPRLVAPRFRERTGMKEATKRATSEALAHMLAVTAMLVIASVLFYWR